MVFLARVTSEQVQRFRLQSQVETIMGRFIRLTLVALVMVPITGRC